MPPSFKPAYLIHGDDHGRIGERRANLRELAERTSGANGVELFEGEAGAPDAVAAALNAMTFAIGWRFLIVDGAERFKDKELDALEAAMAAMPPETTIAFFAREEGRLKVPSRLHAAVKRAGGDIAAEESMKPWELPRWAVGQARALGLDLAPAAAQLLIAHVGDRQQRLLRELEKLALELRPPGPVDPANLVHVDDQTVLALTAPSAERRAWSLADALLTGNPRAATLTYLQLREQGERLGGLTYWISSRLRQAHGAAVALERGQPQTEVKRSLRMPPRAADQLLTDARRSGSDRLREGIGTVADLELASRGGGRSGANEDTLTLLAIRDLTAG